MTTQEETQERSRQGFWQSLFGGAGRETQEEVPEPVIEAPPQEAGPELEIASNDPIVAYFAAPFVLVRRLCKHPAARFFGEESLGK